MGVSVITEAHSKLGSRLNADYYEDGKSPGLTPTRMWIVNETLAGGAGSLTGSVTIIIET